MVDFYCSYCRGRCTMSDWPTTCNAADILLSQGKTQAACRYWKLQDPQQNILDDRDTDFIILAGIRYGIGRASYAPSLICDWIKNHWDEFSDNLKSQIKRDIKSEIEVWFNMRELLYGDSCNASVWKSLIAWLDDQSAEDGLMTAAGENR